MATPKVRQGRIPQVKKKKQAEEVYDLLGYRDVIDLVNTIITIGWEKMLDGTKICIRRICKGGK